MARIADPDLRDGPVFGSIIFEQARFIDLGNIGLIQPAVRTNVDELIAVHFPKRSRFEVVSPPSLQRAATIDATSHEHLRQQLTRSGETSCARRYVVSQS